MVSGRFYYTERLSRAQLARAAYHGTRLPDDAWQTYEGQMLFYKHESKAMYMTYTSFSRGTYDGDGSISGKNGGFRFNAQDHSIGATSSDADGGYVRGVKDEQ